jgi:hypothetical protein
MADIETTSRVEPHLGPAPVSATADEELRAAVEPAAAPQASSDALGPRYATDQLARIEDKTARIEEKYARSEAILQRVGSTVEAATSRMNEVASQSELAALRSEVSAMAARVRGLPGKTALVAVALVTSLLTAAIVLVLMRYLPGMMPR